MDKVEGYTCTIESIRSFIRVEYNIESKVRCITVDTKDEKYHYQLIICQDTYETLMGMLHALDNKLECESLHTEVKYIVNKGEK